MSYATGDNAILTHERKQFVEGIEQAMQYTESIVVPYFQTVGVDGAEASYDRIGIADDMREVTQRYATNPVSEIPFDRRWINYKHYDLGKYIDPKDKMKVVTDPNAPITSAIRASVMRRRDRTVIETLFAPARTGLTSGTNVVNFVGSTAGKVTIGAQSAGNAGVGGVLGAGTDRAITAGEYEGIDIAVDYLPSGTSGTNSGITLEKLRAARKYMSYLDPEWAKGNPMLTCFLTVNQADQLLTENKIINADYNSRKPLTEGQVFSFLNFRFVVYNGLLGAGTSGSPRQCIIAEASGYKFVDKERKFDFYNDPGRKNIPYILAETTIGGARMWGEKIVRMNCLD